MSECTQCLAQNASDNQMNCWTRHWAWCPPALLQCKMMLSQKPFAVISAFYGDAAAEMLCCVMTVSRSQAAQHFDISTLRERLKPKTCQRTGMLFQHQVIIVQLGLHTGSTSLLGLTPFLQAV